MMKGQASSVAAASTVIGNYLRERTFDAPPARIAASASLANEPVMRPAQYDLQELVSWKQQVLELVSSRPDWTGILIDERNNRVEVGVEVASSIDEVRELVLGEIGLPADALEIIQFARPVPEANLQSANSTPIGGLQVARSDSVSWACTLGFNVDRSSDNYRYFGTASHCTDSIGYVQPDTMGQPLRPTDIAFEIFDPPLFDNAADAACPSGYLCRRSDFALARYFSGSWKTDQLGIIAWPGLGSTTYTTTERIGAMTEAVEGWVVTMIGRTSGRIQGEVLDDCWTGPWHGSLRIICANVVDYESASGDSGGPVVVQQVLWNYYDALGTHLGSNNIVAWFTDIVAALDEIEANDGDSSTYCVTIFCAPDPNASITSGPTWLPPDLLCTWTASGSGGTTPYSFSWSGVASGSGDDIDAVINSSGYLTVTVTDYAGHQDSASWWITIDESAPAPPGCTE